MAQTPTLRSEVFTIDEIELAGTTEAFVAGGRRLFPLLRRAFDDVREIAILGWGSQGPAQAQNLRDSLAGSDIRVSVGLRPESPSVVHARRAGFTEADGSLGDMFDVAHRADVVLVLISDAAQVELHPRIFEAMRPGSTLGLSHGFLAGHLASIGGAFPDDIDVVGVCPKGMGPSVRRLYEQGREVNGAGINASLAVEQDVTGKATDRALAWAVGLGTPFTFMTTLGQEYRSDLFGERGALLGATYGIVESLYRRALEAGASETDAFVRACETVTGPISRTISEAGLIGLYDRLERGERLEFDRAYAAAYAPVAGLLAEIYDEVDSGRELDSVIASEQRITRHPMGSVESTRMWDVGATVRAARGRDAVVIDGFAAGTFAAVMTAQIDLLREKRHPWSEVVNESVIEAVDSLIPYMHARGVAYMIDNCSRTARLGARRWGPVFESVLTHDAYPAAAAEGGDPEHLERFREHPVHDVLRTLSAFRPPIDISVC